MNFFRKRPGTAEQEAEARGRGAAAFEDESFDPDFLADPDDLAETLGREPPEPVLVPYPNRPVATSEEKAEAVSEPVEAPAVGPFVARARMAGQAESMPARRRIWDLEAEESAQEESATTSLRSPPAAPERTENVTEETADLNDEVALARAQIAHFSKAGLSPGATAPTEGRAKTRLLGFQSATLAAENPFATEKSQEAQPVACFPVGWIVVTDGPGRGTCFTLGNGVSSIGRGADQAISLDFGDGAISRSNHASIAYDDQVNAFFLGQGGKSNIVRLNGRPVLSTEDLADGDAIRIGETSLRFIALCGAEFTWAEEKGSADAPKQ